MLDITAALRARGEEIPLAQTEYLEPQEVFGEVVRFDGVELNGWMSVSEENLYLRGTLSTVAHARCSGCLKPVDYPVEVDFNEVFTRQTRFTPKEEEWDGEEHLIYEGSKVDLAHLVLSLVMLELPISFTCGEDCPVLSNLATDYDSYANEKDLPDQQPFAALQQLLSKDQEE